MRRSRDSLAGLRTVGPYRLIKSLGRGGMAEVFLAVHRHLDQVRAIKILLPEPSDDRAALVLRLITEARAMSQLRHPGIVEVYECDTLPTGGAFMVMEHLAGQPVAEWLRRGNLRQHPTLAAALVGAVADALAYAHEHGIVHRDIKPENLFVIPDAAAGEGRFRVKVLDFGIAKLLREKPLVATQIGFVVGTPFYMAPEGWYAGSRIDARTDIYSLGCVFFEMLTGRPPFAGEDTFQLMTAHITQAAPSLTSVSPGAPPELAAVVARMLAKNPDDRPASMAEVVESLEAYLGCGRDQFAARLSAPAELPMSAKSDPAAALAHARNSTTLVGAVLSRRLTGAKLSSRERRILIGAGLFSMMAGIVAFGPALVRTRGPAPGPVAAASARPQPPPAPVVVPVPSAPIVPVEPAVTEAAPETPAPLRPRRRPRPVEPAAKQPYQGLNNYLPVED